MLGGANLDSNKDIKHIKGTNDEDQFGIKSTKMHIGENRLNTSNYVNTSLLIGLGNHEKSQSYTNTPKGNLP